jgi:hypothetical protein
MLGSEDILEEYNLIDTMRKEDIYKQNVAMWTLCFISINTLLSKR